MSANDDELERLLLPFHEIGAYVSIRSTATGIASVFAIQCCGRDATDNHVAILPQFTNLHAVGLEGTRITNSAMIHFPELKHLESLDLDRTSIGDSGLAQLHVMAWLEFLHIRHTRVSANGVRKLETQLPKCEIVSDWT
jgi:hypothetical protein